MKPVLLQALCALALATSNDVAADEVRVAVASNFRDAIRVLATRFEEKTSHDVVLIYGSTGKHYAQAVNGAPFDLYFAADSERPALLENKGLAVPGTRFTYAIGRLALWSTDENRVDENGRAIAAGDFRRLAIANPKLAPYGRAARETLVALDVWDAVSDRLVTGENIGQAYQFVASGNAEMGLVAWSQVHRPGSPATGSWWLVPSSLHRPIEQQAVLLKPGEAAEAFIEFVRSETAVEIILAHGYSVADDI